MATAPVRPAVPADRPHLFALQGALPAPNPELLEAALEGVGELLVSPDEGERPAGYLLAIPGKSGAYAAELAVAPERRREGRASALLGELIDRHDRVRLAVAPDNDPARRCYESLGFSVVERDPDRFEDGPALIMAYD